MATKLSLPDVPRANMFEKSGKMTKVWQAYFRNIFTIMNHDALVGGRVIGTSDNKDLVSLPLSVSTTGIMSFLGSIRKILTSDTAPADLELDCGPSKTLRLLNSVYDDINSSFNSALLPAVNRPTRTVFLTNLVAYTFAVDDFLYPSDINITPKYEEGTNLGIYVKWATNGSDGTDRFVKWEVIYSIGNVNGDFSAEITADAEDQIDSGVGAGNPRQISTLVGTIDGSLLEIGGTLKMRVTRKISAGAAPTNNPFGLLVGVKPKCDTIGSRQQFVK
jgi:hypothetical protein